MLDVKPLPPDDDGWHCMHSGAEDVDADDVEGGEADLEEEGDLAPHSQLILTGCWLTMKEISLLLGIIATCAPLPGVCL